MGNIKQDVIGLKLINCLQRSWDHPFKTKSDFSRKEADYVAIAASEEWISTRSPEEFKWTREWRITAAGMEALDILLDYYEEHTRSHTYQLTLDPNAAGVLRTLGGA